MAYERPQLRRLVQQRGHRVISRNLGTPTSDFVKKRFLNKKRHQNRVFTDGVTQLLQDRSSVFVRTPFNLLISRWPMQQLLATFTDAARQCNCQVLNMRTDRSVGVIVSFVRIVQYRRRLFDIASSISLVFSTLALDQWENWSYLCRKWQSWWQSTV